MSSLLYTSNINRVRFSLAGDTAIKDASSVVISTHEMYSADKPYRGGVCDGHLGTVDDNRCETCGLTKKACIGHAGMYELRYPVYNPLAWESVGKWLRIVCHKCGKCVIPDTKLTKFKPRMRLQNLPPEQKGKNRKCLDPECGAVRPNVHHDDRYKMLFIAETYLEGETKVDKLYPHHVATIFSRISDETVAKFGLEPISHPRTYILSRICIPSIVIRPDVRKVGGSGATDDVTTTLQAIIRENAKLPSVIPDNMNDKLEKAIFDMTVNYYNIVRASGEVTMSSLARRFKGKPGLIRRNQLGKRVRNMARSTITGDPTLAINEVGTPLVFAQTIQMEETVQQWNKARLMTYVYNGRTYPGATKIRKRSTGVEYDIDPTREIEVEVGDVILRDLIDGDYAGFNRQPSLAHSAISCHIVKVTRNPKIKTLRMNVIACKLFNADFDGDQMNLIFATSLAARNELAQVSALSNWLISHASNAPCTGQVDDSIIGSAELTRDTVKLTKYHAMLLFSSCSFVPNFDDVGAHITGRECVSKLLERTPINATYTPEMYKPAWAQYIKYSPTETKVVIDQGRLVQGVLDKKTIGSGGAGNIYHVIANEYSNAAALEQMHAMQQMAISFVMHKGFTIGIMDVVPTADARKVIQERTGDMINRSRVITDRLINGEIVPPIGGTVTSFYEEAQINALRAIDDFTDPIMRTIDTANNGLFKLIMFGSKGKIEQLVNMVSSGGQKQINGERIREKFGAKRTLPYFPRCDTSPEARGFIANAFIAGMNPCEYIFNAMAARFDLISKALTTASTGDQTRKSVLSMLGILCNNFRMVVKSKGIIALAYGGDYLDPRKLENVTFPTVMISDSAFDALKHPDFPQFHEAMKRDRVQYRERFHTLEHISVRELMSAQRKVAVNVDRVITDIIREHGSTKPTQVQLTKMVQFVDQFVTNLPYVFMNSIAEKRNIPIPPYMLAAAWPMQMLVRSHLHPNALTARGITPATLSIICDKIKLRYLQALIEPGTAVGCIAAQSYSEPLTQYMLDAHHRAAMGGTSNNIMTQATDILAIKATDSLSSATMMIPCDPARHHDKAFVQQVANNIEVMYLSQFVHSWQIFYEKYAEPQHSLWKHEREWIMTHQKNNPLLPPPGNLIRWCIRFELSKQTMILKHMSMQLLVTKLRDISDEYYIVHTDENSPTLCVRVYIKQPRQKKEINLKYIQTHKTLLMDTIIRGVEGITNTRVVDMIRNRVAKDGSIERDTSFGIVTTGTNLAGVLSLKDVDRNKVFTSAIPEMVEMFGIEAGVQRVIAGLRDIVNTSYRHYLIYAHTMALEGYMTGIEVGGAKKRDATSVLMRMGFSNAPVTLREAAINGITDNLGGVTAEMMVGNISKHGTIYNSFHVNVDMIRKNVKQPDDIVKEGLLA